MVGRVSVVRPYVRLQAEQGAMGVWPYAELRYPSVVFFINSCNNYNRGNLYFPFFITKFVREFVPVPRTVQHPRSNL